jgi:hypothetical protein
MRMAGTMNHVTSVSGLIAVVLTGGCGSASTDVPSSSDLSIAAQAESEASGADQCDDEHCELPDSDNSKKTLIQGKC